MVLFLQSKKQTDQRYRFYIPIFFLHVVMAALRRLLTHFHVMKISKACAWLQQSARILAMEHANG